ncbi:MAG: phenylalanine--tRNA ligase subunit alpha [Hyphomicrobiaceae bacterium]
MADTADLASLEGALLAEIAGAGDLGAIERVRIAALGKKGRVPELMARLGSLPADRRKAFGQAVNGLKTRVGDALERRTAELERGALTARLAAETADVTLPVRVGPLQDGRIHPVSQVFDEVAEIFGDMGFSIAEGPDIETDDLNFTKLNIPPEHPARQEHDTFYMKSEMRSTGRDGDKDGNGAPVMVLRTHTSPVQIRTMMAQKPPIRIIAPGRVYRMDSDATHTPMFHQIEGLVIDETTHLGHLKWCLEEFCKAFFEVDEVRMRFRASHFPFTEPSMEVDIDAAAIGKPGKWLEILGSGMVHPNVISNCGLDPEKYQGFAFGMGLDRIAMIKYGIPDLRDMFAADLRWLRHYGFTALDMPSLAGGLSG